MFYLMMHSIFYLWLYDMVKNHSDIEKGYLDIYNRLVAIDLYTNHPTRRMAQTIILLHCGALGGFKNSSTGPLEGSIPCTLNRLVST